MLSRKIEAVQLIQIWDCSTNMTIYKEKNKQECIIIQQECIFFSIKNNMNVVFP